MITGKPEFSTLLVREDLHEVTVSVLGVVLGKVTVKLKTTEYL